MDNNNNNNNNNNDNNKATVKHSDLCLLIKRLFAVAPSTEPLERPYSKLTNICLKGKFHNVRKLGNLILFGCFRKFAIDFSRPEKFLKCS